LPLYENRMTPPSGCHLKKKLTTGWAGHPVVFFFKWQPDGLLIGLSIFFHMTTGWGCHPVLIIQIENRLIFRFGLWQPDGFHPVIILIWKWEPDDTPIRLSFEKKSGCHFFSNDNRTACSSGFHIRTIMVLNFFIRMQEECIRLHEELQLFV